MLSVDIPRDGKAPRKLAIPTVADRVVHTALAMHLSPVLEAEFSDHSYGYRPGRSCRDAIKRLTAYRNEGFHWIVDADIQRFFDNIPHNLLLKQLATFVSDPDILNFVRDALFQRQMSDNALLFGDALGKGIPQGSPLSPLLANLFLTPLDEFIEHSTARIIRYADDFTILCKTRRQAEVFKDEVEKLLSSMGLALAPDKTRVIHIDQGLHFLGYTVLKEAVYQPSTSGEPLLVHYEVSEFEGEDDELLSPSGWQATKDTFDWEQQRTLVEDDADILIYDSPDRADSGYANILSSTQSLYVTTQGSQLIKRGNQIVVRHQNNVIKQIPASRLSMIVLLGNIQCTTQVNHYCMQHGIIIFYCSRVGIVRGFTSGHPPCHEGLITAQLRHKWSDNQSLIMASQLITTKINNSLVIAQRIMKKRRNDAYDKLKKLGIKCRYAVKKARRLSQILGAEGAFGKMWFNWIRTQVPKEWGFTHRNRRPPKDPVNVLLSLGYTLLFNYLNQAVLKQGLMPSIGYLHHSEDEQPSLVLDLMEPFRAPVVDSLVLNLIEQQKLTLSDFYQHDDRCEMNKHGRNVFITALEHKLEKAFPARKSDEITCYRKLLEKQAQEYRTFITSASQCDSRLWLYTIR